MEKGNGDEQLGSREIKDEKKNYGANQNLWKEQKRASVFTKRGLKSFAREFLENLVDAIDDIGECAFDRKAAFRRVYGCGRWSKSEITKGFHNLKLSGYLEFEEKEGAQCSVKFTDKAKLKVLDKISEKLALDGKKRFISFDIPENLKSKRDDFRQALKDLGCRQIQKSLWASDRNIGTYIEIAAYTFGVEQYVVYIVAEKTDIDGVIEKLLKPKHSDI